MAERRFSVVIATHRRPDLVLQAVQSVLEQTRVPDEVIVVDDGSGDDTAVRLRAAHPDVVVVEQENRGRSVARNRGVAAATGDWVCLLDDDDLWHRDKLHAVEAYLDAHPDCEAVNHPVWFFRPTSGGAREAYGFAVDVVADDVEQCHAAVTPGDPSDNDWSYLDIRGRSFERLLERNRGAYSASVLRRDLYQIAGGCPPALASAEDWTLFLSVARLTEWHTLPRRLAFCRQHGVQSTADMDNVRAILAAYDLAWHGGRPFPERVDRAEATARLRGYGREYRQVVQGFLWTAVRRRRWDLVPVVRGLGRPLLPRLADRLFVLLPPRVTRRVFSS